MNEIPTMSESLLSLGLVLLLIAVGVLVYYVLYGRRRADVSAAEHAERTAVRRARDRKLMWPIAMLGISVIIAPLLVKAVGSSIARHMKENNKRLYLQLAARAKRLQERLEQEQLEQELPVTEFVSTDGYCSIAASPYWRVWPEPSTSANLVLWRPAQNAHLLVRRAEKRDLLEQTLQECGAACLTALRDASSEPAETIAWWSSEIDGRPAMRCETNISTDDGPSRVLLTCIEDDSAFYFVYVLVAAADYDTLQTEFVTIVDSFRCKQ